MRGKIQNNFRVQNTITSSFLRGHGHNKEHVAGS